MSCAFQSAASEDVPANGLHHGLEGNLLTNANVLRTQRYWKGHRAMRETSYFEETLREVAVDSAWTAEFFTRSDHVLLTRGNTATQRKASV